MLSNSEFTQNTCLSFGKVFEYIKIFEENRNLVNENKSMWFDVLRLYLHIQTILLKSLKYNCIEKSILFIGSFYETIIQVRIIKVTLYRITAICGPLLHLFLKHLFLNFNYLEWYKAPMVDKLRHYGN